MATNYLGIDYGKNGGGESVTVICAKRAGKDLKIYAIVRETTSSDTCKYMYSLVCLDKEEGDPKIVTESKYSKLSIVRRRFRNISTSYTKR